MLVHKLTDAECRRVFSRARYGRLACVSGEQPYIVPVTLFLDSDEGFVYGFSTLGQKIRWMRANPRVCIEVEEIVSRTEWTTVLAFGGTRRSRVRDLARRPGDAPLSCWGNRLNGGSPPPPSSPRAKNTVCPCSIAFESSG